MHFTNPLLIHFSIILVITMVNLIIASEKTSLKFNNNVRSQTKDTFLFLQKNKRFLRGCLISNCNKCSSNKNNNSTTCEECNNHFTFYDGKCVKHTEIPKEFFVESCDSYNPNYTCLRCKKDCSLKGNDCKCTLNMEIILAIVICFGFLILVAIILTIVFVITKKNKKKIEDHADSTKDDKSVKVDNNSNKKLEIKEITYDKIIQTFLENKKIPICSKCNKEIAVYELNCGCLRCEKDVIVYGINSSNNKNFNKKCETCGETVMTIEKIKHKCNLCFKSNNKFILIKNKVSFKICLCCYEKYIKNQEKIELINKLSPIVRENSNTINSNKETEI